MFIVATNKRCSPREGWNVYSSERKRVLTPEGWNVIVATNKRSSPREG